MSNSSARRLLFIVFFMSLGFKFELGLESKGRPAKLMIARYAFLG